MKPVVVNPKSQFVVVTYWWGRANPNKNMGQPCPDEKGADEPFTEEPPTYGAMIEAWEQSCRAVRCNHMAIEYPEFAQKGGYQKAINFKPTFILAALKACQPRAVLYIDGDMRLRHYPHVFDSTELDYAARSWNIDLRSVKGWRQMKDLCFDPYVFETSGGLMYFGQTALSYQLATQWQHALKVQLGKADDRVISQLINNHAWLAKLSLVELPLEYLWLNLWYDHLPSSDWAAARVMVEHPYCLTAEDAAASKGADQNRFPRHYDRQVTNRIFCGRRKAVLYEFALFPQPQVRDEFAPWLQWLRKSKVVDVVPWDHQYGKLNSVAHHNTRRIRELSPAPNGGAESGDTLVWSTVSTLARGLKAQRIALSDVIPYVLLTLEQGKTAVVVTHASQERHVSTLIQYARTSPCQFVAKNKNRYVERYKKSYTLELDPRYPVVFKPGSTVLMHLLLMSTQLLDVEHHFNYGFEFLHRIRCHWV